MRVITGEFFGSAGEGVAIGCIGKKVRRATHNYPSSISIYPVDQSKICPSAGNLRASPFHQHP